MGLKEITTLILTIILLLISAISDLLYRRVYNVATFTAMFLGLLIGGFPLSWNCYYRLLWMAVFFLLGQTHMMGMGDLKLCMAVIALRGIEEASWMLLYGALLMLLYCFVTDRTNTILMLKDTYSTIFYHTPIIKRSTKKYPFAVFLAGGYLLFTLIRWWLHG